MNVPLTKLRLDAGHVITLVALFAQAVAIIAVITYRIGAVERRLETLDERLWQHMTGAHPAALPDAVRFAVPRVTRVP